MWVNITGQPFFDIACEATLVALVFALDRMTLF